MKKISMSEQCVSQLTQALEDICKGYEQADDKLIKIKKITNNWAEADHFELVFMMSEVQELLKDVSI